MQIDAEQNTKEKILKRSLKLFNELGETNITTSTIANELKISIGNLYYHFRNKDDIINSICEEFVKKIEARLQFPSDREPDLYESWFYIEYLVQFIWEHRFLYLDLNNLLSRNRSLEIHFRKILFLKKSFAKEMCLRLIAIDELSISEENLEVIVKNISLIGMYWLSYLFVLKPRQYNNQLVISSELKQISLQIISLIAPYLKGKSLEIYQNLKDYRIQKSPS